MRILEADPAQLDTVQLNELIESVRRGEKDFQTRVAAQATSLELAGRMHISEPVYQSLVSLLRKYTRQLGRAERELSRRAGRVSAAASPSKR
jgi:hypothetical protein